MEHPLLRLEWAGILLVCKRSALLLCVELLCMISNSISFTSSAASLSCSSSRLQQSAAQVGLGLAWPTTPATAGCGCSGTVMSSKAEGITGAAADIHGSNGGVIRLKSTATHSTAAVPASQNWVTMK